MFEARISQGSLLKGIVDAMKDLVTDANIDVNASGMTMQAMDSSHVSLCALLLRCDGFEHFRCDRNMSLGVSLKSLGTILKCADAKDTITLKADEKNDNLHMVFENGEADRVSDFEMKLMDIDSEHLGIPDTEYKCVVKMSAKEFSSIIPSRSIAIMSIRTIKHSMSCPLVFSCSLWWAFFGPSNESAIS